MTGLPDSKSRLGFLHDAELLLISIDARKKTMQLKLQLEDATPRNVKLWGVTEFRFEGLSQQNIVYGIRQSRDGELTSNEVTLWQKWVRGFSDSFRATAEEQEKKWLDQLSKNEINLVVIESSTGMTIAAVCEKLMVSEPPRGTPEGKSRAI